MHEIGPALGRFHQIAMSGALDGMIRGILGGEDMLVGMKLVWPIERARAGEGAGVVVSGAAFGGQKVIPAIALVDMGSFGQRQIRAVEDDLALPGESSCLRIEFLQRDPGEKIGAHAVIPEHLHEIFAAIVVVEKRGVEA